MKNTVCKNCGKDFHICSSCGKTYNWQWDYCSENCYMTTDKFKVSYEAIKNIAKKIGIKDLYDIVGIIDESDIEICDFFHLLDILEKEIKLQKNDEEK